MGAPDRSAEPQLKLLASGARFRQDLLGMLEQVDLLEPLSADEMELLTGYVQAFQADAGCTVFREGERSGFLCLLVSGRIRAFKEMDTRNATEIADEHRGRSIGEMSLIDGEPRSATCVAVEPSVLLFLTRENFERMSEAHPRLGLKLARQLARLISRRLRMTSGRLVERLTA